MADLKITVPDELLAECRKAAERVAPGKKVRIDLSMSLDGTITAYAGYRASSKVSVGAFVVKKPGGGAVGGANATIEFESAP
jgi:hypothetical protein